jgi:nitrogen fixation-related uncharacterized protein
MLCIHGSNIIMLCYLSWSVVSSTYDDDDDDDDAVYYTYNQ